MNTQDKATEADPASGYDQRYRLINEVFYGRMRPEEAEVEALRLGLRPLQSRPDIEQYDPMNRATWTLAMAIAWISWRTPERVLNSWEEYCRECWDWVHFQTRLPVDGGREWEEVSGWELQQRKTMTVNELSFAEALDEVSGAADLQFVTIKNARDLLWSKLAEGELSAAAVSTAQQGRPVQIPQHEWPYLGLNGDLGLRDELRFNGASLSTAYQHVTLRRVDILQHWEPLAADKKPKRAGRPFKYDWPPFHAEVIRLLEENGDFDASVDPDWHQSKLEAQMSDWCMKNWGSVPSESSIRSKTRLGVKAFRQRRMGQ